MELTAQIKLKMQNTSRVRLPLNNFLKYFFVAGLGPETLHAHCQLPLHEQIRVKPEVLFSLYQPESQAAQYL